MTIATLLFALIALPNGAASGPAADADAERSGAPIMLDFTASWCGPCRQMKPAVEQLVRNGYPIRPVDIDRSPDLAERYEVTGVPTFVVIDPADGRELARTSGAQPASSLADLYRQAKAKARAKVDDRDDDGEREPEPDADAARPPREHERRPDPAAPNPKPWETVVRIKVHGQGFMGYGSGTVIHSTPKEALILTCAHIFKIENRRQQPHPSKFPLRITIDLFDGKLSGQRPAQVHYANETLEGQAVDYDFAHDVGLIRVRPGRRIPFAKVVPPYWTPKARMGMITVGCSEGHDATAWNTVIVNPGLKGLNGNGSYEAIECMIAPKQGRSGGGLFTSDGYVAGVCDFAEPRGNHGLYASPRSIYGLLDRNRLVALYDPSRSPAGSDRLIADNHDDAPASRGGSPSLRFQSPDRDDAPGSVTLPPPEMLNIKTPAPVVAANGSRAGGEGTIRRQSWHASPSAAASSANVDADTAELKMDPGLDPDRFDRGRREPIEPQAPDVPAATSTRTRPAPGKWKAGRSPLPALAGASAN